MKFLVNSEIDSYVVDNISCTTSLGIKIDIKKFLLHHSNLLRSYNNERFPGCFIRGPKSVSVSIFQSGKINFVGGKNLQDIEYCSDWIKQLCLAITNESV